jgi:autoinducer 2-degrading protein
MEVISKMTDQYHVAIVTIKAKRECIDDLMEVIQKNAQCSRKEAGVLSFEVMRKKESPGEFLLIEMYKSPEDQVAHRNTAHYLEFKEKADPLLAEPYGVNNYGIIPAI